jgi:hypothetical protein
MIDYQYTPANLGVNGVLLSASGNSNAIPVGQAVKVRLDIDLTWGAATDVSFLVQTRRLGDTDWKFMQLGAASPVTAGQVDYSDYKHVKAVTASKHWTEEIDLTGGADQLRLMSITGTGATTDVVSISATVLQQKDI